jgi:methionyl-tRNA formyltransferase
MAGDEVTGATTFRLVEELDAGPTYGVVTETIGPADTAGTLLDRLAEYGAGLLMTTLDGIEDGVVEERSQPPDGISLAPKVHVHEARVAWTEAAYRIDRHIRGCTPAPGAWTTLGDRRIKIGPVGLRPDITQLGAGDVDVGRTALLVGTGTHAVELDRVQAPGKPWMRAPDWGRGLRTDAARFGDP